MERCRPAGAVPNDGLDDAAAFIAAVAVVPLPYTVAKDRVHFEGDGMWATTIVARDRPRRRRHGKQLDGTAGFDVVAGANRIAIDTTGGWWNIKLRNTTGVEMNFAYTLCWF